MDLSTLTSSDKLTELFTADIHEAKLKTDEVCVEGVGVVSGWVGVYAVSLFLPPLPHTHTVTCGCECVGVGKSGWVGMGMRRCVHTWVWVGGGLYACGWVGVSSSSLHLLTTYTTACRHQVSGRLARQLRAWGHSLDSADGQGMENVYYELVEGEEVYVRDLEVVVEVRRVGKRDRGERWRVEKEGYGRRDGG